MPFSWAGGRYPGCRGPAGGCPPRAQVHDHGTLAPCAPVPST